MNNIYIENMVNDNNEQQLQLPTQPEYLKEADQSENSQNSEYTKVKETAVSPVKRRELFEGGNPSFSISEIKE